MASLLRFTPFLMRCKRIVIEKWIVEFKYRVITSTVFNSPGEMYHMRIIKSIKFQI